MSPTSLTVDRSQAPPPGRDRPFRFPTFHRRTLGPDLELFVAQIPRVPLVRLDLFTPAGGHFDPRDQPGLAASMADMLDEGNHAKTAPQIAAATERLGGSISTGAGWNSTFASASMLSRDLEHGAELLAEIVRTATFPVEELERQRQKRLADLLQQRNDPRSLAGKRFSRVVFDGTPYGSPLGGTEKSLRTVSQPALVDFYDRYFPTGGSRIVAVGDLDPEEITDLAGTLFGDFFHGPRPELPSFEVQPLEATEVHIVDRPGAAQTELLLGHAGICRRHPDFASILVMNSLLGGKFTSRINLNLRERHGYTYGAYSQFMGRLGPGPFTISTAVGTEVTAAAVREIFVEIRRIQQERVTEEELAHTKSYLRGIFAQQLQTVDDLAFRLGTLAVYDLPDDYFDQYFRRIEETDRQQVLTLAQEYLHPDRMAIIAVGPAVELMHQLKDLGSVRVWSSEDD